MTDAPRTIRAQVQALMAARPDVSQVALGRAIGRSESWVSLFLSGKRQINDLTLTIRIARFFGVSVGYLLREHDRAIDPEAKTLLAAFDALPSAPDRDAVVQLARMLARRGPGDAPRDRLPADAQATARRIRR